MNHSQLTIDPNTGIGGVEDANKHSAGDDRAPLAGTEDNTRARAIYKVLALSCAIFLAFGSHFAGVSFGTLKSSMRKQMGLSNTQYAVAQSSNDLMGTFIPLLAGFLYDYYGTGIGSLVTTGVILLGTLMVAGAASSNSYILLVAGRVVYGFGAGSVSVVQQTIVARWFDGKHLSSAMAALLLVNRIGTSVGNAVVVPIMEDKGHWSWSLWVTAIVAGGSVVANIGYLILLRLSKKQVVAPKADGIESEPAAKKHAFRPRSILYFAQVFWLIILIHMLEIGVMNSYLGLSSDLIKMRFKGSDAQAAYKTTISLAVPIVLYFIFGPFFDRVGHRVTAIFASCIIMVVFCVFIGFTSIDPIVAMILLAAAIALKGLASLTAIPLIIPLSHLGTAFAIYRCINSIGSCILDITVGAVQDATPGQTYYRVMVLFTVLSVVATLLSVVWLFVDRKYYNGIMQCNNKQREPYMLEKRENEARAAAEGRDVLVSSATRKSNVVYAALFFASIVTAWVTFFVFVVRAVQHNTFQ